MVAALIAAALAVGSPEPTSPRRFLIMQGATQAHRYVRLDDDVAFSGVRGTSVEIIDRWTGRYVRRVSAGPLSYQQGFDEEHVWNTDATGMPAEVDDADDRLDELASTDFYGRTGGVPPQVNRLASSRGNPVFRLQYHGLSGPIDVTLQHGSSRVRSIDDRSGLDVQTQRFFGYRVVGGVSIPQAVQTFDRYGMLRDHVHVVSFPRRLPSGTFSAPPPPRDVELEGVTSLPIDLSNGTPVVPLRIDDGPELHVMFDTGSQNFVTPSTARRLGLTVVGLDRAGGIGEGTQSRRYTTARLVTAGSATLRDQPFAVLESPGFPGLDGTIGCEFLQRFAVRFNFPNLQLDLARDVSAFAIPPDATAIPMRLAGCTPEVSGALDGMPGRLTVDTGNGDAFDVMAPFVRTHHLVERYHAGDDVAFETIGGIARQRFAKARTVDVGPRRFEDVPVGLSTVHAGVYDDPVELGNVGVYLLRRYVLIVDVRTRRMWLFSPPP